MDKLDGVSRRHLSSGVSQKIFDGFNVCSGYLLFFDAKISCFLLNFVNVLILFFLTYNYCTSFYQ